MCTYRLRGEGPGEAAAPRPFFDSHHLLFPLLPRPLQVWLSYDVSMAVDGHITFAYDVDIPRGDLQRGLFFYVDDQLVLNIEDEQGAGSAPAGPTTSDTWPLPAGNHSLMWIWVTLNADKAIARRDSAEILDITVWGSTVGGAPACVPIPPGTAPDAATLTWKACPPALWGVRLPVCPFRLALPLTHHPHLEGLSLCFPSSPAALAKHAAFYVLVPLIPLFLSASLAPFPFHLPPFPFHLPPFPFQYPLPHQGTHSSCLPGPGTSSLPGSTACIHVPAPFIPIPFPISFPFSLPHQGTHSSCLPCGPGTSSLPGSTACTVGDVTVPSSFCTFLVASDPTNPSSSSSSTTTTTSTSDTNANTTANTTATTSTPSPSIPSASSPPIVYDLSPISRVHPGRMIGPIFEDPTAADRQHGPLYFVSVCAAPAGGTEGEGEGGEHTEGGQGTKGGGAGEENEGKQGKWRVMECTDPEGKPIATMACLVNPQVMLDEQHRGSHSLGDRVSLFPFYHPATGTDTPSHSPSATAPLPDPLLARRGLVMVLEGERCPFSMQGGGGEQSRWGMGGDAEKGKGKGKGEGGEEKYGRLTLTHRPSLPLDRRRQAGSIQHIPPLPGLDQAGGRPSPRHTGGRRRGGSGV
ncbi:unnamed protein product, partial [Closterium sp. NIES-54]